MSKALRSLVTIPLLLLLSGCSQGGPQAVPIKAVDTYSAQAHSDGLSAGAEPFDTYVKSTNALGNNVSRDFTPVQLVVESKAPDKFLLQRSNAKLICGDGKSLEAVSALTMLLVGRAPGFAACLCKRRKSEKVEGPLTRCIPLEGSERAHQIRTTLTGHPYGSPRKLT